MGSIVGVLAALGLGPHLLVYHEYKFHTNSEATQKFKGYGSLHPYLLTDLVFGATLYAHTWYI